MMDVIKEYLISLGFSVNSQSINQARQAMRDAEGFVSRFAGSSQAQFAIAGAAVTTFVATANIALASFMHNLAQTELRNEMFARAMYTTTDNATAFTSSLQAMGRTMEELYLSPELIKQFQQLQQQSFAMRPPAEFKEQMKFIRSVAFEFQRLKLEVTYALQWVGYYLFKYMEGPLKNIKLSLQGLNDSIVKNMPKWTKTIAEVFSWVARLGLALYSIKDAVAVVAGAFLGFKAFNLLSSPIGLMIAGMTALLLLVDDYNTYENGGKSLFGDTWKEFDKILNSDIVKSLKNDFKELSTELLKLTDAFGELISKLNDMGVFKAIEEILTSTILYVFQQIHKIIQAITTDLNLITDILNGNFNGFLDNFGKFLDKFSKLKSVFGLLRGDVTGVISDELNNVIKDKMTGSGNSSGFFDGIINTWNDLFSSKTSNTTPVYAIPQTFHNNVSNNHAIAPVFNIYSSGDANAIATAVSNKTGLLTRNFQGWA